MKFSDLKVGDLFTFGQRTLVNEKIMPFNSMGEWVNFSFPRKPGCARVHFGTLDPGTIVFKAEEQVKYTKADWQLEVANGDTIRGFEDWVTAKTEQDKDEHQKNFQVHTYAIVRIAIGVAAPTPELALAKAQELQDAETSSGTVLHQLFKSSPPFEVEYAEDIESFLVDEIHPNGDITSVSYDKHGKEIESNAIHTEA